jgi:hypothetical protein
VRADLVPAVDPAPLPGPPWLFHTLWLVTFSIHLLLMNLVLGGTLLAAFAKPTQAGTRAMRRLMVETNSWAIALAITFGIAPLLFVQVLYGRFFYSATLLVAWGWLGMLGLLTLGYYMNYVSKFRLRTGKEPGLALPIAACCFVLIAVMQVVVNLLHMQPERWERVADQVGAALADPTLAPRLLHFILGALALTGAFVACAAIRGAGGAFEADTARDMARLGVRTVAIATVAEVVDGLWLMVALPREVLQRFMSGSWLTILPLLVGTAAGLGVAFTAARIRDPLSERARVHRIAAWIAAAILVMVVTRHQVREAYLAPARSGEQVTSTPQWGAFLLFLGSLVLCLALTGWIVRRVLREPAPPRAKAAL